MAFPESKYYICILFLILLDYHHVTLSGGNKYLIYPKDEKLRHYYALVLHLNLNVETMFPLLQNLHLNK